MIKSITKRINWTKQKTNWIKKDQSRFRGPTKTIGSKSNPTFGDQKIPIHNFGDQTKDQSPKRELSFFDPLKLPTRNEDQWGWCFLFPWTHKGSMGLMSWMSHGSMRINGADVLVGWLAGWLGLVGLLAGWLVGWLVFWWLGWLAGRRAGWPAGLMVGRMPGWMAGLHGWILKTSRVWDFCLSLPESGTAAASQPACSQPIVKICVFFPTSSTVSCTGPGASPRRDPIEGTSPLPASMPAGQHPRNTSLDVAWCLWSASQQPCN